MNSQLLLLEDVEYVGRKGDLVKVKAGHAHNYLIPRKKALFATKQTVLMQKRLQEERLQQAQKDRAAAELLAADISSLQVSVDVKIDAEGHMYGSVSATDIVRLLGEKGISVSKSSIALSHPIKTLGAHAISIKLKEGVLAKLNLHVLAEGEESPT